MASSVEKRWLRVASAIACAIPCFIAIPASANDKPAFGPPASWVVPASIPADDGREANLPFKAMLRDEQIDFEQGATTIYYEIALKAQNSAGLGKVGSVALPWNPEIQDITIHKLHILRDGQRTDALAAGSKFTVIRRERNLERAMLDGKLTAALQIEGLRIGDIVDIAYSIRSADPALHGHHATWVKINPMVPLARLRARWKDDAPVHWQETGDLAKLEETRSSGYTTVELRENMLANPVLPRGAPTRYFQTNKVDFTDYRTWADVSSLMLPLYVKASTFSKQGELAREADRIAASTNDPFARAEAALSLVQQQVRYEFIGLNDGGYVPADADVTWSRRFADCKGKTVLLLGLLHALGISADPVLVNTQMGDAIPRFLPSASVFDHVIVRAVIAGKTYWLDGTRLGDRRLSDIQTPRFSWGLLVADRDASLVPISPDPAQRPLETLTLNLDGSRGFTVPISAQGLHVFHGDSAIDGCRKWSSLPTDERDSDLKKHWRALYSFITPDSVSLNCSDDGQEMTMKMHGEARLDWENGNYEIEGMTVGYAADFTRDPGPDHDAPFVVTPFPAYFTRRETIALPDGGRGYTLDDVAFDGIEGGIDIRRNGAITEGKVVLEASMRAVAPEFDATTAMENQATLRRLGKQHFYVHAPKGVSATDGVELRSGV